jgi:hypothetical protein
VGAFSFGDNFVASVYLYDAHRGLFEHGA